MNVRELVLSQKMKKGLLFHWIAIGNFYHIDTSLAAAVCHHNVSLYLGGKDLLVHNMRDADLKKKVAE